MLNDVGDHFEVLALIEEPVDDGPSGDYSQWMAVGVIAAADGTGEYKKPTATGQMRKVNVGWFFVRYEDDGAEEWLRLNGACFNNNARGSWRVDLDFSAVGGGAAAEAEEAEEGDDDNDEGDDEDDEDGEDEDDGGDEEEEDPDSD